MKDIDKSIRFTNFLLDMIVIYILWMIYAIIFDPYVENSAMFYAIMFFYYLIMEWTMGQTLGKIFTKTKVVQKNGGSAGFLKILMRSFLRIIPIDAMSYMFGTELGFHNKLSRTKLSRKQTDLSKNISSQSNVKI